MFQQIHLWDLNDREQPLVRSYAGLQQSRYIVRAGFGGTEENFVVSGSEGVD